MVESATAPWRRGNDEGPKQAWSEQDAEAITVQAAGSDLMLKATADQYIATVARGLMSLATIAFGSEHPAASVVQPSPTDCLHSEPPAASVVQPSRATCLHPKSQFFKRMANNEDVHPPKLPHPKAAPDDLSKPRMAPPPKPPHSPGPSDDSCEPKPGVVPPKLRDSPGRPDDSCGPKPRVVPPPKLPHSPAAADDSREHKPRVVSPRRSAPRVVPPPKRPHPTAAPDRVCEPRVVPPP